MSASCVCRYSQHTDTTTHASGFKQSINQSIYRSIHLSIHLSIYPSIHLSIHPSLCLSINLSIFLSIHPSIYLSACLYMCFSIQQPIYYGVSVGVYTQTEDAHRREAHVRCLRKLLHMYHTGARLGKKLSMTAPTLCTGRCLYPCPVHVYRGICNDIRSGRG